jgi:hypothetical protein
VTIGDAEANRKHAGAQFCEPYRKLMSGPSRPRETILMRIRSSPLECFLAAVWDRHVHLATIAFVSFCAEVLTILLPSIPYGNTEVWQAYQISHWMSLGIIIVMLLTLCWVTATERRSQLPRSPITTAGALSYLSGSRFVADLEVRERSTQNNSQASAHVASEERYLIDWLYDMHQSPRWIIEKEA